MADRPEDGSGEPEYFLWAASDLTQVVVEGGKVLVLDNKKETLPEFQSFGLKYGQPPDFQEINNQFNGYSLWFQHLDERYSIGDIHKTTSGESEAQISARLGGTWVDIGTESIGGETITAFRKTG